MSWQQQLEALGLNDSNMPNMIKKAVRDHTSYQKQIEKTNQMLSRDNLSDRKRGELEDELETYTNALDEQSGVIERKIKQWDKNKDMYAAKGEKLQAAQIAKKGGQVAPPKTKTPEPPMAPSSVSVTPIAAIENPSIPPAPSGTNDGGREPKEEKSNWGWLVLVGVVAIASLGAINLSKNE